MAYLDSSGQDASPSFLQSLAQALGMGAPPPPAANPRALASALAGTHYAQLPGPPLLLRNDQDTAPSFGAGGAMPAPVPQVAPPAPAAPMRGSVADIQAPGMAPAAVTPSLPPAASPAAPGAAPAGNAIVVPGYEAKGPLTRAQVVAAPDDDKTMPAEEDWDQAAALKAKTTPGAMPATPGPPATANNQYTAAVEKEYSTAMAGHDAEMAAARSAAAGGTQAGYELAKGHLATADRYLQLATAAQAKYDETLKPGWHYASSAELSPGERASGAEYQVSPLGEHSKIAGTEGDKTRAPNAEEAARLVAAGEDPKHYESTDGKLERIPTGKADSRAFGVIGEDQFGNKQYGFTDKTTGEVTPYRSPAAAPGSLGGAPSLDLHGDEFMKTLDPKIAGQVKAIVEGRAPYPTGMLLRTPYGQQLAAMVTQADPTFESGNSTARVAARKEFESGGPNSVAGTITSGNAAIKHLGELSDDAEALGNRSIPAWNAVANAAETQTGDKRVTNFNNTIGRFGEEATKFYRGIGGSEADVQRDIANLSPNMSPEQLRGAIQKQANLMRDKIVAYQDRWHKTMGPMVPDFPIVDPSTQNVLNKLDTRAGGASVTQGSEPTASAAPTPRNVAPQVTGAPPAAPAPGTVKGGYRFKGGDPSQQNNWEHAQ